MANSRAFGTVVVAFDGSKDSAKAVQIACSISAKYGSKVTVLHVYRSPSTVFAPGPGMAVPDFRELEDAAEETGRDILSRGMDIASKLGAKPKGELMESPSVVEAVVTFAAQAKADLIVVGTRGMTGFRKLVMGSVSSGVVSHAKCPVLVVR